MPVGCRSSCRQTGQAGIREDTDPAFVLLRTTSRISPAREMAAAPMPPRESGRIVSPGVFAQIMEGGDVMSSVSQSHADLAGAGRPKLKRSLGLWMATALVIGNMVGSGVFGLPASLASTGPISLLSWIFTGAGAILLALVFANLGRAYPETGGPYAYARRAFGDFAGFWTAWGYWIAAWAGNAAIATIFVSYASVFWPSLGTDNVLAFTLGLSVIWVLTLANCAGARESGIIQLVTTVLKFVPLLLIGLIGLFYMHSANFTPFDPNHVTLVGHWHAISFAATLTLWAFLGLESATVPA